MRLLVINTVGEAATADLRRRHPGQVLQRPLLGGAPLVGRRVLERGALTPLVVDRIEYLASIGNARAVEMGSRMPLDFDELRRRLGHPVKMRSQAQVMGAMDEAPPDDLGVVPKVAREDRRNPDNIATPERTHELEVVETFPPPAELATSITSAGVDAVLDALGAAPASVDAEVATPEAWVTPEGLDALVRASKNADLSSALAVFGGTGAGKNKLKLVGEVEAYFSAADGDAALKFKALEILRTAQEG